MKLSKLLLLYFLMCFIYSCSDNKNEALPSDEGTNIEAEKQINEAIDVIANDNELSTFKEALSKVDAKKFVENEFTILAYKNKQTKSRAVSAEDETLRHIIGGKYTFDALKKLKQIVALSKDTLHIKYSETENTISLNGVLIGKSILADKSIVFVTDSIVPLAKDTVVVKEKEYLFKVMKINANWSPENNMEDAGIAENALINIYKDDKVIKELRTDKDGLARFSYQEDVDLDYVVKTDTSSMFYHDYFVKGLFTSQEQVEAAPIQKEFKAVLGGLRLADDNGDGIVDSDDTMDRAELSALTNNQIIYLVGKSYTFPKNEPELEEVTIDMAYDAYDDADDLFLRFDNQYSTLASRQSLTATSKLVDSLWHNSYEAIRKINIVMTDNTTTEEDRIELEGFRANLFFKLANTFGDIPLQLGTKIENLPRTKALNVYDAILKSNDQLFNFAPDSDKYNSDEFINSLLIYREQKRYSEMSNLAQQAINSGTINLHPNFVNSEINAIRIYLLAAEANNERGELRLATDYMNVLLVTEGKPALGTGTTQENMRTLIREYYNKGTFYNDRIDEGIRYVNIMSWSLNSSWNKYKLLPIPASALEKFGSESLLMQNPGY